MSVLLPCDASSLSTQEQHWSTRLPKARSEVFIRSRVWMRACLANCFNLSPQSVPLQAPPGEPPTLPRGWGFLSLSHCPDALLLGCSKHPIGLDLERHDRMIPASSILQRAYCLEEQERLQHLQGEDLRRAVLKHWLIKEASIKWQQGAIARDLRFWEVGPGMRSVVHQRSHQRLSAALHPHDSWEFAVVATDQQLLQSIRLCLT